MYKRQVRELAQTDADTLYMPYGSYEEAVTVKAVPYFPVSYTHLDVYKRQDIVHVLRPGHRIHHDLSFPGSKGTAGTAGAVSYTHLDVYKRQL